MDIESQISAEDVLDRICQVYGFTQKVQLANHFDIAASTLQNRYTRGNVSYDFAAFCALETGVNIQWLLTGQGVQFQNQYSNTSYTMQIFTLSEGRVSENGLFVVGPELFTKPLKSAICLKTDNRNYIVEKEAPLADGQWVVDIEGAISIRDLTVLPGKKLHVAGGKITFECEIEQIKTVGRIVGVYNEVN